MQTKTDQQKRNELKLRIAELDLKWPNLDPQLFGHEIFDIIRLWCMKN